VVFALRGDLGAGKSVLARAIAHGAGVSSPMPSPTFNLLFQYQGHDGRVINHLDLYRLEDPSEVWELGWRDLAQDNQIVMIEWPEHAEALLATPRWDIRIAPHPLDLLRRIVTLERIGDPPRIRGPA
jgi:tRNA threonylcarbamoyladenosine biosynthesis protein TsaE